MAVIEVFSDFSVAGMSVLGVVEIVFAKRGAI